MKKRWTKLTAIAAVAAMVLGMAGCGKSDGSGSESAGEDTVTVGLLHSLTGSMAISEGSVRDAEVLAIEEINKNGGVLGKQIYRGRWCIRTINICNKSRKTFR